MPIYEYRCDECGNVFEELQKDFSEHAATCPLCNGQSQRIMSNTSFILKGSGWYVTDYARNGSSSSSSSAGGNGGNGSNGSNGKNGTASKNGAAAQKTDTGAAAKESPKPSAGSATKESSSTSAA